MFVTEMKTDDAWFLMIRDVVSKEMNVSKWI